MGGGKKEKKTAANRVNSTCLLSGRSTRGYAKLETVIAAKKGEKKRGENSSVTSAILKEQKSSKMNLPNFYPSRGVRRTNLTAPSAKLHLMRKVKRSVCLLHLKQSWLAGCAQNYQDKYLHSNSRDDTFLGRCSGMIFLGGLCVSFRNFQTSVRTRSI